MPSRGTRQVDAGVFERQAREFESPGPEALEAHARGHGLDVGERLQAHRRVLVDHHFFHREAGAAEQIQVNIADLDFPPQGPVQTCGHSRAKPVRIHERRDQTDGHHQDHARQPQSPDRLFAQPHGSPPRAR